MLCIVVSHFCIHGGFDLEPVQFSFNKLLIQWGRLGDLGVDIFIIITGYFLSEKGTKLKQLCNLFTQVWFYSITIFIVFSIFFPEKASFDVLLKTIFPTIFKAYWFFTAYVVLTLISPLLNLFIKNTSKKIYIYML